jgi:nicotinamide-nucleotide amidase
MPTAEIITIGTELLLGETTDTNTRFIAQVLRGLGVDLFRTQTIGDNAGRIAESIREATGRANIVICTGGLGPTVDDPTRQAIAEAVGKELEFHPELWEQIIERIARYGRKPTMNQKRQAFIPKGAIIIENPVGTAPAFIVETVSGSVISLPGVPREMETLLTDKVVPYLQEKYNLHSIIKLRTLHVSGLGEGVIDDKVGDLETLANPTVGLTAHSGVVDVRIAAKAGTEIEADQMIAGLEKEIRKRLNENIFGADYDTIESVTIEAVTQHGWNLASFEYKTEGVLKSRLAQIGNPTFLGGELLLVSPENLLARAEEIRTRLAASVVLGIAFSDGSDSQGLDLIWVTPMGHEERRLTYGGHPGNARRWAVNMALDGLRRAVGRVTK